MTENLINCGQRKVQKDFRVVIRDVCLFNDIKEGDIIEVFIKKTD